MRAAIVSGAAPTSASIGLTETNVTPIMIGRRMPMPGRPIVWISVATPAAIRSAQTSKVSAAGARCSARPMTSGTVTAPAYITSTCCRANSSNGAGAGTRSTSPGMATRVGVMSGTATCALFIIIPVVWNMVPPKPTQCLPKPSRRAGQLSGGGAHCEQCAPLHPWTRLPTPSRQGRGGKMASP